MRNDPDPILVERARAEVAGASRDRQRRLWLIPVSSRIE
jgi:hypothetical protein